MPSNTAADNAALADRERLADDVRRLGLVGMVALAGLAVIALAWTATPANASAVSTTALALGAFSILSLSVVALGAAHRRAHKQLRKHTVALEHALDAVEGSPDAEATGAEGVDLEEIQARLSRVEEIQNEHLVELIDATDPPTAGEHKTAQQG